MKFRVENYELDLPGRDSGLCLQAWKSILMPATYAAVVVPS
jgi:hypothetical protein